MFVGAHVCAHTHTECFCWLDSGYCVVVLRFWLEISCPRNVIVGLFLPQIDFWSQLHFTAVPQNAGLLPWVAHLLGYGVMAQFHCCDWLTSLQGVASLAQAPGTTKALSDVEKEDGMH